MNLSFENFSQLSIVLLCGATEHNRTFLLFFYDSFAEVLKVNTFHSTKCTEHA